MRLQRSTRQKVDFSKVPGVVLLVQVDVRIGRGERRVADVDDRCAIGSPVVLKLTSRASEGHGSAGEV